MAITTRPRLINPRLGTYFGIFASSLAAFVFLSLIFEQLGVSEQTLRWLMLAGPLIFYSAIGVASKTNDPLDYFVAGRRVPAGYSGLTLSVATSGATLTLGLAGSFFIIGFDALCLALGMVTGFVFMAILLAPFYRKFGAYTLPGYLGRRFESRFLRICSAGLLLVPLLLVLGAELRVGGIAASILAGGSPQFMILMLAAVLMLSLSFGGMRSLTWSSVAQGIALMLALIVPAAIIATDLTNLPIPQLTHGPILRALNRNELAQALPAVEASALAFGLPADGFSVIAKRFAAPFESMGRLSFALTSICLGAGVAVAPWLLPRVAATPGVYEARKSLGWAIVFLGIAALTIAAASVFLRDAVMGLVLEQTQGKPPSWVSELTQYGFVQSDGQAERVTLTSFAFNRDSVLFSLPVAARLPTAFLHFAIAGAIAAALASAGAAILTVAQCLSEDILNGLAREPRSGRFRVILVRISLLVAALLGSAVALAAPGDPLRWVLWAFALTASTLFSVMVLSIWWKRLTFFGALAGIGTGFSVAVTAIFANQSGVSGLDGTLAGALGIPASGLAAVLVSLLSPSPTRHMLELVRDIRVPGGEILYDREMRLRALKKRDRQ